MRRLIERSQRRRDQQERGAALVLAIVIVVVFGAIAISVTTFAFASFSRTIVVKERTEKVAAANAGIRYTLEQLQLDPTLCASPAAGGSSGQTVGLPSLVRNRAVQLTCRWSAGLPTGVNGWALALTGENVGGNDVLSTQSGSLAKVIKGPLYLPSTAAADYDLKKEINVERGNVIYRAGSCNTPPTLPGDLQNNLVITSPSPPYGKDCTTAPWTEVVKLPTLPTNPPTLAPLVNGTLPYKETAGGCRIFFPGTYNASRPMDLGGKPVYLASGVYYLDNLGEIEINNELFAGAPGPSDKRVLQDHAGSCGIDDDEAIPEITSVANNGGANGTGVTLILGGNTKFYVNKGHFEVFRRTSTSVSDPLRNVSVVTVPAGTPNWNAHGIGADELVLLTANGSNKGEMVLHGMVFSPYAGIEFGNVTSPKNFDQFLGGLVASRAVLQSSSSIAPDAFVIATDTGPFTRDLVLESKATDTKGGVPITATVVVQVSNETGRPLGIRSWRVG